MDSDHKYVVRSPVVVYNVLPTPYIDYSIPQKKQTNFQRSSVYPNKNGILGRD
ncbi:putative Cucumisin precursor [Corchorus capsularis]|uniref:Putative Cucumisin n=1 Tax=Corchorus capsularis TaxID=210143 RepID=A0A1R3IG66_COCAP|nr:putative Cucumisin precursor [Corchorus capsularis]